MYMRTTIIDVYDEKSIKDAEKRTEKYKSAKRMKEIKHFINSRVFKELDFPADENLYNESNSF
jgi:hypothetical protein